MKTLELTQGQVAWVDDDDFERLSNQNWFFDSGYAARKINGKKIRLHRYILKAQDGQEIDHINRNKLDCRKSNLRLVEKGVNIQNSNLKVDNTSGFRGVHFVKTKSKWVSYIYFGGIRYHLGYFRNPEDAARKYDEAALKFYGEHAMVNFPTTTQPNKT